MSSCLMINSPKTGERIKSNLFEKLESFDSQNADDYFMHTLSKEYSDKYGNWGNGTYQLETDGNGEPVFNNSFIRTIEDFEKPKADLKGKLTSFIEGMGFSYETVDKIISNGGSSVSGVTDFLLQTVNVIEGSSPKTLAEEAAHIYVEWLEQSDNPLFNSLYNDVTNFEAYNQVLQQYGEAYENDEHRLRKEAIGKVLADVIIKGEHNESEKTVKRIESWWERVKNWLNGLFGVSSEQLSSFLVAKDEILSGETSGVLNKTNYKLYDLSPAAQKAIKTLVDTDNAIELKETTVDGIKQDRYHVNGKMIKNRVSDLIKKLNEKIYGKQNSESFNLKYEVNRKTGTLGHTDIQNIINRFIQKTKGSVLDPVTNNLKLSSDLHLRLTRVITDLLNDFPPNSQIFTEVKIHDVKTDTAGTIDLLIIDPDGKVHMFDWKFIDSKKDGVINATKKLAWTTQLNAYKSILESYGFKDFGKMRMIPIQTKYTEDGKFDTILVDNSSILQEQSVPSKSERTGKQKLDQLLNKLNRDIEIVNNLSIKNEEDRIKKNGLLDQINKAILDIQIYESLDGFVNIANKKIENIKNRLASSDFNSDKELKDIINELKYYQGIRSLKSFDIDILDTPLNRITTISDEANELLDIANDKLIEYLKEKDLSIDSLTPSTFAGRLSVLGVNKNPIFQYFNRLRTKQEDKIDSEQNKFNDEIRELQKKLKDEDGDYDKILEKDENGKPTGNLIKVFKKEFWNTLPTASVDWIMKNTEFKKNAKEEYEKQLEIFTKDKLSYVNPLDPMSQIKVDREIERFKYNNDYWNDKYKKSAYKKYGETGRSKFVQPSKSWYSDEYKFVNDNRDKAISKLYFKFQDVIEKSRQYSTSYIPNSFIPSIQKSFIKKLTTTGSIKGIVNDVVDNLKIPPYERATDENGNLIYKIPLKYRHELRGEKSLDLGTVFSLFNHSVLQNEYLGQIENESLLLEMALQAGQYRRTDWKGNPIIKEGTVEILASGHKDITETVDQFRQRINEIIYQVKDETKDFELGGVSGVRIVDRMIQWFSMEKIGLSPFTAVSNVIGGQAMLYSMATRTKHFDVKDVVKSQQQLVMRNSNALAAIKYFDILTSNTTQEKAKQLSMSNVEKAFSIDNFYTMMKWGEEGIQYSALNAYLNANTLDKDGLPIKKTDPAQLSILEMFEEVDGKVRVKGLSDDGYNMIRKRARGFAAEVMGSLSERDSVLVQRHLMGRALLQFKRWMLPMGRLRFGSLTYNDNLDEFEEGKFKRVFSDLIDKRVLSLSSGMIQSLITKSPNQTLQEKIEEVYNQHILSNPEFAKNLSLEQYTALYMNNIRSTAFDMIAVGAVMLLFAGFKDDEDTEDQSAAKKFVQLALAKGLTEMTFWFDSDAFMKLGSRNSVPVIGLVDEFKDLIVESSKFAFTLGQEGVPGKKLKRMIPGLNQVDRIEKQVLDVTKN